MEAIKQTKTVEEIVAYVADDGTRFKTEEECKKYEESAEAAILKSFIDTCVCDKRDEYRFSECSIYEKFGYGSEEYDYCVVNIKNENDLKIANMYAAFREPQESNNNRLTTDTIGKRVLVALGNDDWNPVFVVLGTLEEEIEKFKKEMSLFFYTREEREEMKKEESKDAES